MRKTKKLPPIHPGEVLKDTISEAGLTVNALAMRLRVPPNRLAAIIKGQRSITVDTALRLGRYFGISTEMWMNLQMRHDIEKGKDELAERVEREVLPG